MDVLTSPRGRQATVHTTYDCVRDAAERRAERDWPSRRPWRNGRSAIVGPRLAAEVTERDARERFALTNLTDLLGEGYDPESAQRFLIEDVGMASDLVVRAADLYDDFAKDAAWLHRTTALRSVIAAERVSISGQQAVTDGLDSGSGRPTTTASGPCSTPGDPTGTYCPPPLPTQIRSAGLGLPGTGSKATG